ncbi:hypothetical protein EXIGLDRAFT_724946 [Exidia glandulosa HHB12029]|uniref:Uncharacterized protein n=1 Tax=Exidia glandulosa HHB12029 TaxID=1314781 RepID=A0A165MM44_EXIGL|nr:hypothetical protein EXIGLDRAFT_724946 [Exidia glandulosa HHB12029]
MLRPTPADALAASQSQSQSSQSLSSYATSSGTSYPLPKSLSHLSNALQLPVASFEPRIESGITGTGGEWPYHPSQVSTTSDTNMWRDAQQHQPPPQSQQQQWKSMPGSASRTWGWVGATA